jgi:hypothetical protein
VGGSTEGGSEPPPSPPPSPGGDDSSSSLVATTTVEWIEIDDESDDVSPPTAEPLLCDILHTIEMAKEIPDDCSMPLQEFFALVSLRASLTPQLPNRLRMAAARRECVSSCDHRALWTL